ncbi:hypothetical protein KL929_001233 [Ogataea haglerorum]|uniref:uncharacterized protein n=1 Tax=Ogataea haglerorum TaxID=1937702 RepID=UPI001C89611B|nr:uncharacterized protein KL911_001661 [Ogataea haglerorum]KAG7698058.1 hypothetical protein KL915_001775 [Ogataea haglerorum]KAG7732649.1 hypothetical protein KL948_002079 [Ogataea haglerorum]KAG7749562.1 hypothetical protein KL912_001563 [Ogataea haglerorum]KAG7755604.1 hypothetical protein KL911_001661 [Ogataea haglerorum]KAG7760286.1 hypothetical protein KL947_001130 [Ogataea haglerorum]
MSTIFGARVKNVLSADTLVLVPLKGPSTERILTLGYVQAPRLNSGEKYAFEARELLRTLLVGKEIKFWILYKNQSEKEFGDVSTPLFPSLISYLLERGAVKLRSGIFDDEALLDLQKIEAKARDKGVGMWAKNLGAIETANELTPSQKEKSKTSPLDAIVERVISGDRLMVRALVSKNKHAVFPVLVAGIKAPRTASAEQEAEPFGEQAKSYVEARLLARNVKISVVGESSSGIAVAQVIHPAGKINAKLLEEGLAVVADWQSVLLGASEMADLRKSERIGKSQKKNLWHSEEGSTESPEKNFNGTIAKVISADTLVVRLKNDSEITVQLASLRGPRQSDPETAPFVAAAKEFVRSKAIGKQVRVVVESIRPKTEQLDERSLVSVFFNDGTNLSDIIVSNGYASVLKFKSESKPDYWDSLIESELQATKLKKGMHGRVPEPERVVDASESAARAKPYLFSFQNRTKIPGIVEHITASNRFKIAMPREGLKLTFVLGGLANPRGDDAIAEKALAFTTRKAYQREVHLDIYNVDKFGGFIGNLYLPGSGVPFQISLLQQGFAECHERSLAQTKYETQFLQAEEEAREKKLGVWATYQPEEAPVQQMTTLSIGRKYYDVVVTDVSETIALQILDDEQKKLSPFMKQMHASSSSFKPLGKPPKVGALVAAKFSENGKFYRALVVAVDRQLNKYKVRHVDYGNSESVPLSDLRELPANFGTSVLKPQAHVAQFSLVKLPPAQPIDYLQDAIYFLEDLILDRQLVACETFHDPEPGVEMDVELYDPETISKDPKWTVNKELVSNGLGIVKKSLKDFEKLLSAEQQTLLELEQEAKRAHKGCWEHGDIEE